MATTATKRHYIGDMPGPLQVKVKLAIGEKWTIIAEMIGVDVGTVHAHVVGGSVAPAMSCIHQLFSLVAYRQVPIERLLEGLLFINQVEVADAVRKHFALLPPVAAAPAPAPTVAPGSDLDAPAPAPATATPLRDAAGNARSMLLGDLPFTVYAVVADSGIASRWSRIAMQCNVAADDRVNPMLPARDALRIVWQLLCVQQVTLGVFVDALNELQLRACVNEMRKHLAPHGIVF